jgi:hypothetical protein
MAFSEETARETRARSEAVIAIFAVLLLGLLPGCTTMGTDDFGNERPAMSALSTRDPPAGIHRYATNQRLLLSQCASARGTLSWDSNNCVIRPNNVGSYGCVELMVKGNGDPDWADAVCAGWRPAATGHKQAQVTRE